MRNYNYCIKTALAVFAVALSACSSDNDIVDNNSNNQEKTVSEKKMSFSANMDAGNVTRTDFNSNSTIWAEGDVIKIVNRATITAPDQSEYQWYGNFSIVEHTGTPYTKEEVFTGTKIQSNGDGTDSFYAFYPSDCNFGYTDGKDIAQIKGDVKTVQTAINGSYDQSLHFMTAHSNNSTFSFKNVCALLKITLTNSNISRIKVVANPNVDENSFTYTYITGAFIGTVSKTDGTTSGIEANGNANEVQKTYVELRAAGDGGSANTVIGDGTYYMVVLPVAISNGFTLTLETSDGNTIYQRVNTKTTAFERNKMYDLGTYDCSSTPTGMTALTDVVDLGLPSGTLWATKNIAGYKNGVDSMFTATIYDHGQYYAWGEDFGYYESSNQSHQANESNSLGSHNWTSTTTSKSLYWPQEDKDNYSWVCYKWFTGGAFAAPSSSRVCKYVGSDLHAWDDIAYLKSGGRYSMPVYAQFKELLEYCTYPTSVQKENKKAGARFTSKIYTTKSIWLPAAGSVYNVATFTNYRNRGEMLQYWSRSYCSTSNSYQHAFCLDVPYRDNANSEHISYDERYSARTIRAVVTNDAIAPVDKPE